ncbi:hypothetical protein Pan161_09280 [Gimesia algae]|uniref:Tetratricopeptide repeat protein n=1 Tax=Gimesia algae TaxID=2527971 RepID=A0A517V8I4_9PLAN|nr:hypothetical protein Pan161_09280 [Gimesia algae]
MKNSRTQSLSAKLSCACLVWLSLSNPGLVFAQEALPAAVRSETSLLLMKTGRMVSGEISESAGGYLVKNPTGSMVVPFESVLFEAKDLHEIYLKQRAAMKYPTANSHLDLARWCITNELYEEAKSELRDAIRLEPKRSEPQLMLRRLMGVSQANQPTVQEKIQETLIKKQLESSDEATSLTGISREQSALFVRKIQPIMLNKCGNANCHGNAAKSEFRLTQVTRRYGNHRFYAEKNLAEVLRWINLDDPLRSQLLVKSEQEHPQQGIVVYTGYAGRKQQQVIQTWVADIVADRIKQDQMRADRLTKRAQRRSGSARENLLNQAAGTAPINNIQQADMEVKPARLKGDISLISGFEPKKLSDQEINELVKEKPADPFDPAQFNNDAVPE